MAEINNIKELKNLILTNDLSKEQTSELLRTTLKGWYNSKITRIQLAQLLQDLCLEPENC